MSVFWYRFSRRETRNSRRSLSSRKTRSSLNSFSALLFTDPEVEPMHPSTANEHASSPSTARVAKSTGAHATMSMRNHVLR